jgi:SAM-dependent methyltransferase
VITSIDDPSFWDKRYKDNSANWDLKTPTPFFISLIDKGEFIYPSDIILPGCGKGYDAVYAAEKGFKVTAADFSSEAINFASAMAREKGLSINFINEDIFNINLKEQFDFIFEYTTFCAINPSRRIDYIKKLAEFLKPGGRLIALLFPVDGRAGGPPFNIDPIETYKMISPFLKLEFYSSRIDSIKPRAGREVLHIYKKI